MLINDIQEYINNSWKKLKNIKIIKVNNKYQVLTGVQYFKYMAEKINSLEKFNNYFNQNKGLLITKTLLILLFIFTAILVIKGV